MSLEYSRHAAERFAERFPGEDPVGAAARAVRVPFERMVSEAARSGSGMRVRRDSWHLYYRDPVTDALFVVVPDGDRLKVVTVWHFPRPPKKRTRRHEPDLEVSEW